MIVVADTSPLRYLVLIDEVELLHRLYGNIVVPPGVLDELSQRDTPALVQGWIQQIPEWIDVCSPKSQPIGIPDKLGRGEREAIALALELNADALLADDLAARTEAGRRKIPTLGTLGILDIADKQRLTDSRKVIERLQETNFRAGKSLIELFLKRHDFRRAGR
jgi:predicted nucleic acid-binding protein